LNQWLTEDELSIFKKVGNDVLVSRHALILDPDKLEIGYNTRIDHFAYISGDVEIGNYTHIAHYVHLSGKYKISIGNYVGVGSRTTIYTESDDYKNSYIGPQIPTGLRKTYSGKVTLGNYVAIGIGCFIMPNTTLHDGACLNLRSNAWGTFEGWKEYVSPAPNLNATYKRGRPYR